MPSSFEDTQFRPRYNRNWRVKITVSKENYLKAIADAESDVEPQGGGQDLVRKLRAAVGS
jgi:hypothetical protein